MIWAGLTGGVGTGKSTVTHILRSSKIPVVCADELSREVVRFGTSGNDEVLKLFGPEVLDTEGNLDRKAIGVRVFKDKSLLKALEDIIHPRVRQLTLDRKNELSMQGVPLAFYDVPLLFEKKMENLFDKIVVVHCDLAKQKERLILREGFSAEEADRRIAAQSPLLEKIKKAHFTIDNNGTVEALEKKVRVVVTQLLT